MTVGSNWHCGVKAGPYRIQTPQMFPAKINVFEQDQYTMNYKNLMWCKNPKPAKSNLYSPNSTSRRSNSRMEDCTLSPCTVGTLNSESML
eukprot:6036750-Amphidinium_carterae.1